MSYLTSKPALEFLYLNKNMKNPLDDCSDLFILTYVNHCFITLIYTSTADFGSTGLKTLKKLLTNFVPT